ncbi:MAG TPA: DUF3375 family protein [Mycobacterium sp.]|nr:DUF3375 family protein [Mycobacterium sp.]
MSLLRSPHATLHLALMAAHLGDGQIVDGQTLTAAINADLPTLLRDLTDAGSNDEVVDVMDAGRLLGRWTKRGWVYRSVDPATRVERYQLTSGAVAAVRQIRNLQRHSSVATESALAMVMLEMRQVATDANPDPLVRREAINAQVAALVAQRDALDQGVLPEVDHRDLVDRVVALSHLVERIPADVARYGEQMHANTATLLRQTLADDPAEFGEVLARMFAGHDVIAESAEGHAFRSFATLIATPSQRSQLETDIVEINDRVRGLPGYVVETLGGFIEAMWRRVQDVEDIRALAFRRMSNFVRGGDALHYRSLRTRIGEAQASAAAAFTRTHGGRDIGFVVPLSGANARSVGRLRLHPGSATRPDPVVDSSNEFEINAASLAGHESIDWAALRHSINVAMDNHGGLATLPEVLEHLPHARTGEVIGLWLLATRHGVVDEDARSVVLVETVRGLRELAIPYLVFGEHVPEPTRLRTAIRVVGLAPAAAEGLFDV